MSVGQICIKRYLEYVTLVEKKYANIYECMDTLTTEYKSKLTVSMCLHLHSHTEVKSTF